MRGGLVMNSSASGVGFLAREWRVQGDPRAGGRHHHLEGCLQTRPVCELDRCLAHQHRQPAVRLQPALSSGVQHRRTLGFIHEVDDERIATNVLDVDRRTFVHARIDHADRRCVHDQIGAFQFCRYYRPARQAKLRVRPCHGRGLRRSLRRPRRVHRRE